MIYSLTGLPQPSKMDKADRGASRERRESAVPLSLFLEKKKKHEAQEVRFPENFEKRGEKLKNASSCYLRQKVKGWASRCRSRSDRPGPKLHQRKPEVKGQINE